MNYVIVTSVIVLSMRGLYMSSKFTNELSCPRCYNVDLKTLSIDETRLVVIEELECNVCHFVFKQPITSTSRWMKKHLEEGIKYMSDVIEEDDNE